MALLPFIPKLKHYLALYNESWFNCIALIKIYPHNISDASDALDVFAKKKSQRLTAVKYEVRLKSCKTVTSHNRKIIITIFKYYPHPLQTTSLAQQHNVSSDSATWKSLHRSHFLRESRAPFAIWSESPSRWWNGDSFHGFDFREQKEITGCWIWHLERMWKTTVPVQLKKLASFSALWAGRYHAGARNGHCATVKIVCTGCLLSVTWEQKTRNRHWKFDLAGWIHSGRCNQKSKKRSACSSLRSWSASLSSVLVSIWSPGHTRAGGSGGNSGPPSQRRLRVSGSRRGRPVDRHRTAVYV